MDIVSLFVVLIFVGVVLYLVNTVIPMPYWVKQLINVLAVVFLAIWIFQSLGLIGHHLTLH